LTRSAWQTTGAIVSLLVLWLLIFLPTLGKLPLIRSEAMYAQIPLEMLESGDWLTPRLNGARYLDKPPLIYWINLTAYKLGDVSDNTARWATFMIGLGETAAILVLGTLLYNRLTGWLAAMILLSSIGFFALHLQMLADHLITLTVSWSLVFVWLWRREPRPRYALGFYLCAALGVMSKSLIGLFFPLAIAGLFALLTWDTRFWRFFLNPGGLLVFTALTVPWFWVMEIQNPGFLQFHLINEQISRFFGQRFPPDITPITVGSFWLFTLVWLMPWTPLLPVAIAAIRPKRWLRPDPAEAPGLLLLLWAGVVLLFYSLCSARIEYYNLPALPALALIIGWRLEGYLAQPESRSVQASLLLCAVFFLALLILPPFMEQICEDNRREFTGMFEQIQPLVYQAIPIFTALAATLALASWRRWPRLSLGSLGSIALVLLYFTFQCLSVLSPHLSDAWAGKSVRQHLQDDDVLVMGNIEEFEYGMSFRYYARTRVLMVQRDGLPDFGFALTDQENFLVSPDRLMELWQGPQRIFLLMDDCAPEDYLPGATTVEARGGKRLLVNKPLLASPPLHDSEPPLSLREELASPPKGGSPKHDTFTR